MWEQEDYYGDYDHDERFGDDYVVPDEYRHSRKGFVDEDDSFDPNDSNNTNDIQFQEDWNESYGPKVVDWERIQQEELWRRMDQGAEAVERSFRFKQNRGPVQYPEMQPQFRERNLLKRNLQKVQDREATLEERQRAILEAERSKLLLKRGPIPRRILTPEVKERVRDISIENIALKKERDNKMPSFVEGRREKYIRILESLRNDIRIGQQLFREQNFGAEFNSLFQKYDQAFRFFEIPKAFECRISFRMIEKPLCIISRNPIAQTYSSSGWQHMPNKTQDPYTKERVDSIVENKTLKNAIDEWSEISKFFSDEQKMFEEQIVEQKYKKHRFEDILRYIRENIAPKVEEQYNEIKVFEQDSFTRHLIGAFNLVEKGYLTSLFCPESGQLFKRPMIDIRTGISYEEDYLKIKYSDRDISQHFRVNNQLKELLEFYQNILEKKYLALLKIRDVDGGGFDF